MGVWRWGEREIIYLSLHCHHQNDFCIKSAFCFIIVRDKITRQCPQTTTFEGKGEPKQFKIQGPSAYQPNALPLGQTGSHITVGAWDQFYSAHLLH